MLTYFLLFQSFKKYASNYAFAMVIFMGLWFYFSFTYLRQVLGASIAWLSIRYIIDRKPLKFFLVMLLAMSMHKSAIILIPVYFLPMKKYAPRDILYLMIFIAILGITPIPNAIFSTYGDISVVEMQGDYNSSSSFRFAYALEAFVFLYIILNRYKYIKNDNQSLVMLNLALMFCATLLFFVRSPNGGRLAWYFMLGLIVTISNVVSTGRGYKNWSLLMIVLVALNATKAFYQLSGNGALSAGVGSNDKNTSLSHIRVIFVKFRLFRIELFRADSLYISNVSPT